MKISYESGKYIRLSIFTDIIKSLYTLVFCNDMITLKAIKFIKLFRLNLEKDQNVRILAV